MYDTITDPIGLLRNQVRQIVLKLWICFYIQRYHTTNYVEII